MQRVSLRDRKCDILTRHFRQLGSPRVELHSAKRIACRKPPVTYLLVVGIEHVVDGLLGDDDGAAVDADTAACTDPEEHRILHLGVVHQLDDLVEEDPHRRYSHAVLYRKHRFIISGLIGDFYCRR